MKNINTIISDTGLTKCSNSNIFQTVYKLENGWKFYKVNTENKSTESGNPESVSYDDSQWKTVTVPHDWAIEGPFDKNNDIQNVAILEIRKKYHL